MNRQENRLTIASPSPDSQEMKHWVDLRRAILTIVAAVHRVMPNGTYTLDVQIVPRNQDGQL